MRMGYLSYTYNVQLGYKRMLFVNEIQLSGDILCSSC